MLHKATDHGLDDIQVNAVLKHIVSGKDSGKLSLGGIAEHEFVEPIVFTKTREDAQIMKEKVFRPVVNTSLFHTVDKALTNARSPGSFAAVSAEAAEGAAPI